MSSVDSTVPPIVSPTGEMIQPGPLSYNKSTSGTGLNASNALLEYYGIYTGQRVSSRTPELNEPPATSALGSSGQPLQPNSKTYADDFQSSGPVFTSSNRKVGNMQSFQV